VATARSPSSDVPTPPRGRRTPPAGRWLAQRRHGRALFITSKTVSVHVTHILAKLGVTSRGAASPLAHREGMFVDDPL
jgi:hypothetical protein